jgi:anti-sigma B factor antagonist
MVDDRVVVVLTDASLQDGLADLRWQLRSQVLTGARVIVVDIADLGELSSGVVSVLLGMHRICRARGGGLVLRNPTRRTSELLSRTGLSRVLLAESA